MKENGVPKAWKMVDFERLIAETKVSFWNCLLREMIGGSTSNRNGTVYGWTVGTQGSVRIWELMLSKKGMNQVLKRDLKLVSGCIKDGHQALTSRQDS